MSATVTVTAGFVHPSDLEVSWETSEATGQMYHWVQVSWDADRSAFTTAHYEAESFEAGLELARKIVATHAETKVGLIPVAQVNVSDHEALSFLATVMEPAAEMRF